MVGGPMKLAVNQFIADNPTAALHIAEGLAAMGVAGAAAFGFRGLMKVVNLKESDLPEGGMEEIELLEEHKPEWFIPKVATGIHASLVSWKMRRDTALPQVDWKHGEWAVDHKLGGFDVPSTDEAVGFEVTVAATPVLDTRTHTLR